MNRLHLLTVGASFGCLFSLFPVSAEEKDKEKEKIRKVVSVRPEVMRPGSAPQPGMILRDEEGREIEAELVSAHGETVKIQRLEDAREFDVPIEMFDEYTEERIRSWIENDPDAVEYSLKIDAERNLVDSSDFETGGRKLTTNNWCYTVTISNESRNDLTNAQVEYRIIFDDHVAFMRTSPMPGDGEGQQDGQAVDLPTMEFNDEIEFRTPAVETHIYEFIPSRGDREYLKDDIKGIWVRVIRFDEVIAEYRSNMASMQSLSWDGEEDIEIRFTNDFKDSFDDESTSVD
ncbi:MAG: hypothetical protein AAGC68_07210 [Verrucomicrobiota bacterium]